MKKEELIGLHIDIDQLISTSYVQPIIIVQGDHGPGSMLYMSDISKTNLWERMSILNALYLPGVVIKDLPPDLSPVNSFRVVFNKYFGTNYELLPNKSYFSPSSLIYQFTDVTKQIPKNSNH